ncbi:MAG: hypothetical protein H7263_15570 [Candidatus Sericytochromatia bacterium]|nr:hypothetical protein [Candidatus Sericytochromatia bacterium]
MSKDQQALTFHFNTCITALNFAKVDDKMNRTERTSFSIINYKLSYTMKSDLNYLYSSLILNLQ